MRKETKRRSFHMNAQRLFLMSCLASFMMVYVAAAAPQKSAVSQESKPSTKVEPSLFAPSVSTAKGTNQAARRQPVRVSEPRVSSPAEDWVMDLTVNRQPAENWEDAYDRYFKEHQVHPQTIRLRIRDLTEQKVPDLKQVIGLLRAALRAGQIQPWMYEALALAMRIEKMPEADIERVLLSSADFATSAGQIIFLAEYMDRLGYRQRALELLREAALRDPAADVAYAKALNIAIYLGDEAGLRWATLGVLGQDWVQENTAIFDKATRHAQAVIEQMRKSGRDQEADHYAAEVKEALRRDIVVKVSWNGDADVDLVVEEPSGSVCSYIQNKTPGGGLLLGELDTKLTQPASGSHAEVYSCPEAFSGDYRVLLRQIWGRIPAGLVTVDVWSHLGTEKEKHIQKVIPLDDTGAVVSFQLDQGRRKEGLADQRLANDVVRQVAINRTILAQQLDAVANPEALAAQQSYLGLQPASQIGNPLDPLNRPSPNAFNPNLVGYQPQITVLPVGVTMSANAVISADRRYVRITSFPFFSLVKGVVQYNLQSGVTDQAESDEAFADADLDIDGAAGDGGGGGGGGAVGGQVLSVSIPNSPITLPAVPASFATNPDLYAIISRTGPTTSPLAVQLSGFDPLVVGFPNATTIPVGSSAILVPMEVYNFGSTALKATAPNFPTATTPFVIQ